MRRNGNLVVNEELNIFVIPRRSGATKRNLLFPDDDTNTVRGDNRFLTRKARFGMTIKDGLAPSAGLLG